MEGIIVVAIGLGITIGILSVIKNAFVETMKMMVDEPIFVIKTIIISLISSAFGYIIDGFVSINIYLWGLAGILLAILIKMITSDF